MPDAAHGGGEQDTQWKELARVFWAEGGARGGGCAPVIFVPLP